MVCSQGVPQLVLPAPGWALAAVGLLPLTAGIGLHLAAARSRLHGRAGR